MFCVQRGTWPCMFVHLFVCVKLCEFECVCECVCLCVCVCVRERVCVCGISGIAPASIPYEVTGKAMSRAVRDHKGAGVGLHTRMSPKHS